MKKIGICGNFGVGNMCYDGQTVKTKILKGVLETKIGKNEVQILNTFEWYKNPIKLLYNSFKLVLNCKNILLLPAQKGVKIFIPLFLFFNIFFNRKINYIAIGAWLNVFIRKNWWLKPFLKKIDNIFVETLNLSNELQKSSFENIKILYNFKNLNILDKSDLNGDYKRPYRLCTFSRVLKEKGITDAINVIARINKNFQEKIFILDIYGKIDNAYKNEFNELLNKNKEFVKYKGIVNQDESVNIISSYFLLLFPTRYLTEGIPGTIIDSYSAGVPVLTAEWNSSREIVRDGETGIIFKFLDLYDFEKKLLYISENPKSIIEMKENCLKEAQKYTPDKAIQNLLDELI